MEVVVQQPKLLQHNLRPLHPLRAFVLVELLPQILVHLIARISLRFTYAQSAASYRCSQSSESRPPSETAPSPAPWSSEPAFASLGAPATAPGVWPGSSRRSAVCACTSIQHATRVTPAAPATPQPTPANPCSRLHAANPPSASTQPSNPVAIIKCTQFPRLLPHMTPSPQPSRYPHRPDPSSAAQLAALLTGAGSHRLARQPAGSASPAKTASAGSTAWSPTPSRT